MVAPGLWIRLKIYVLTSLNIPMVSGSCTLYFAVKIASLSVRTCFSSKGICHVVKILK